MALFRSKQSSRRRAAARDTVRAGGEGLSTPGISAASLLVRPHVTEKAGRLGALNQYVFVVAASATKPQVAQAVFEVYGVRPIRVETVRMPAKRRRLGRSEGFIPGFKKAIVTLPQGKTIETFPK